MFKTTTPLIYPVVYERNFTHWLNFDSLLTIKYVLFIWHVFPYKKFLKFFSAGHEIFVATRFFFSKTDFSKQKNALSVQLKRMPTKNCSTNEFLLYMLSRYKIRANFNDSVKFLTSVNF